MPDDRLGYWRTRSNNQVELKAHGLAVLDGIEGTYSTYRMETPGQPQIMEEIIVHRQGITHVLWFRSPEGVWEEGRTFRDCLLGSVRWR